mmetsp:Transcript_21004/g.36141  ORF Transcript_21004/g.36141 Transcript_21004/m.36141 type:complete len:85 (+) Transcript_21004:697-951(+)
MDPPKKRGKRGKRGKTRLGRKPNRKKAKSHREGASVETFRGKLGGRGNQAADAPADDGDATDTSDDPEGDATDNSEGGKMPQRE